jgi:cardiolipin synthase
VQSLNNVWVIVSGIVAVYALVTGVYLILENRRPQATLAWMLVFIFAPGIGLVAYLLFGRSRKAFSKQSELLRQDLEGRAMALVAPYLERQDVEIARQEAKGSSHVKMMMLVRRNSQSALTRRNQVQIQQDAVTFYPSLMADMRAARHSIHLQYFIWAADAYTERFKDILAHKARAGVQVRLLYDALGSRQHLNRRYLKEMQAAGISVAPTSPLYRLHTISYRNHRKITVIDGAIGYTGGMNIGQEHVDGGPGFDSWRDTQLRVVGEAARLLQTVFMVDWYNAVRENLFFPDYFPQAAAVPAEADNAVQILTSGPDSRWAAIRQLYFAMITSARKRVCLQSPYFVLDATIAEAVKAAALAGVDVSIMISERPSGNPVPDWAGKTFMAEVAVAGANVYLYRKGYLHAKTISIDGQICSIGSANIDIRSFSINYEINAVLYNDRLAQELEARFEADLEHCVRFDADEYERERLALRFRDSVARLFSPLL